MQEKIKKLLESYLNQIEKAKTSADVFNLRVKVFGKSGEFTELLKGLKDVDASSRPTFGKILNDAKVSLEEKFGEKEDKIKTAEQAQRLNSEKIDITLPGFAPNVGTLHPLTLIKNEVIDIFTAIGFTVVDGPEIETDYYNFQSLNIPSDHPARDMQDSFYINENILLRTQTSPMQIRAMENMKPPLRILCPGKVYRADDDATHSPMFHQIEGLVVDKNITMRDLKGVLDEFAKELFDSSTKTRLRPSYFPFTEPSVEVDLSCAMCKGKGCRLCKGTGWMEILGAGIVNRRVLKNCKIDPDIYSGFAFGMGIERIAMIKYGIPDMRMLFENDLRFLKQFK